MTATADPAVDPVVSDLVREIESRGLRLGLSGADLRLQGPRDRIDPALVARIKAVKPKLIEHLSADEEPAGFGLTLLQRGYLIGRGDAVEMGNVASYVFHEIAGHWDIDRLEAALQQLVARHGMLRTHFTGDGRQVELPPSMAETVRVGRQDLRRLDRAGQQARLAELRAERAHRILPADRAPMLAVDVVLLADDEMVLHVGHDGLILDGISMFLFFRQWHAAYTATEASTPDAPEEASFAAYVAAMETARTRPPYARSRDYWIAHLDEIAAHPNLPLTGSPAAITAPRYTQHVAQLDADRWSAVKALAARHGVTATGALLSAYADVLQRWGAGDRFTLASTIASRPPIHPRIVEALGNFNETLLVSIEVDPQSTFAERATALHARMRRDIDNRHFSGIEVLRELAAKAGPDAARMPYTFNSAMGYLDDTLDGSTLELFGPETHTSSQTPQLWLNGFAFEQHGGVVVQFDEVQGLFPDGLVAALVAGYQRLLTALADEATWISAAAIDLLPTEQRERRAVANDTAAPQDTALLPAAFIAAARAHPEAAAIVTARGRMSYGELYARATQVCAWLRTHGVGPDDLVGLVMHRGAEHVVGIMGIVMAGAAYLPVDAKLPLERQRYLLADGGARCVVTNVDLAPALTNDRAVLRLDARTAPPEAVAYTPAPATTLDHLAYVLYTSGTTGEPKGVMISQRSVANVVADCNARFGITAADRFFAISAFNFDLSVYDVFGALSAGAAVVVPDHDRAVDPDHWLDLATRAGVTVWNSVPAIVSLLAEQAREQSQPLPPALRLVMMSGDRIPPDLPARLWAMNPQLQLISLGGPTETTIWNIWHPIAAGDGGAESISYDQSIPYGRPNANNRAYVLDADGRDAPDWITGEICAAGVGLARGYWGDPERTAARFFDDAARGERLFRTGDLGRYLPDGSIGILGRSDFQIKINGYRIEAGEVETHLIACAGVKQAVVTRQSSDSGDRLVAHVVAEAVAGTEAEPSEDTLRAALREELPEYMVPSVFVWHAALPLTGNNKVDRAALAAVAPVVAVRRSSADVSGATEQELIEVWAGILHRPTAEIAVDVPLPELGGNSLAAARILTKVRKQYGVSITLERMFEVDTVRRMAEFVDGARSGA